MVRFLEDPEQYKTCEMIEHIDSSIQRYASLKSYHTASFLPSLLCVSKHAHTNSVDVCTAAIFVSGVVVLKGS